MKLLGFYGEKPYVFDIPIAIVDGCEKVPLGEGLRCAVVLNEDKNRQAIASTSSKEKRYGSEI